LPLGVVDLDSLGLGSWTLFSEAIVLFSVLTSSLGLLLSSFPFNGSSTILYSYPLI